VSHPFGRAGSYDGELERSYTRMLRLTYDHLLPGSTAVLEAMMGPDLQPVLGDSWKFVSSQGVPDGKGCLSFQIVGQLVSRRAWSAGKTCDLTKWTALGGTRNQFVQLWMSYRNADHDAIMTALLDTMGVTGYYVSAVIPNDNDDGSTDYARTMTSVYQDTYPEIEPRFCMMKSGKTIEYRPSPTDSTRIAHQVRYHHETIERLYTNNITLAKAWAETAAITTAPKGETGADLALWGYWHEREKGTTRYVAYRCVEDFNTPWDIAEETFPGTPEPS